MVKAQFQDVMRRNSENFDDSDIYKSEYIVGERGEEWEELRKLKKKKESYDFEHVYARSIVAQQHWPWSMMVDPEHEIVFYKNEATGAFQADKPKDFHKPQEEREKYIQVSTPTNTKGLNIPKIYWLTKNDRKRNMTWNLSKKYLKDRTTL